MLKLKIPDMTCGHCAAAVTKAVKEVESTASVKVDLPTRTIMIEAATQPARIREVLDRAGYPTQTA